MTDKQIIIDGVDVSGCLFFTQYGFCIAQLEILGGSGKCSVNNQNCDYKQLKRKEQECKELKQRLQQCWKVEYSFVEQLDQLKAEKGVLKKANNHIEHNRKQKADKLMRIEKLITACSTGYTDEFIQELLVILHEPEPISFENKYKATLAEIKEIAEVLITTTDEYDSCYYKDRCSKCEVKEDCQYLKVEQILQKISEVEDG